MRMISSANCLIVISRGLPMLTGSWKSLMRQAGRCRRSNRRRSRRSGSASRRRRSVSGWPVSAWPMKAGHDAAIAQPHPRAVGVEDADDLRVHRRDSGGRPSSSPRRNASPHRKRRAGRSGSRCPSNLPSADARADRRSIRRWRRGGRLRLLALARPSALCVPSAPTFSVGIGSSR